METKGIAKAGQLLSIEHGEYSDYGITGFFVALRDFDPIAEARKFRAATADKDDDWEWNAREAFIAGLIQKGFLLELQYAVLHLDGYGRIGEESTFTAISGGPVD